MKKLIYTALVGLFMFSCEGPEGPAGPQGTTGTPGQTGATGAKGEAGDPAGAIQFKLNSGLTTKSDGSFDLTVNLPNGGSSIVENGVVLLYMQYLGSWVQFPTTMLLNDNVYTYQMSYQVANNQLIVSCKQFQTTGTFTRSAVVSFSNARIVVVPATNARLSAEIDFSDYETVRRTFNLPE